MQTASEVDMRNKQKSKAGHRRFDKLFIKIIRFPFCYFLLVDKPEYVGIDTGAAAR